jgi:type II secretory pathway pseudopilin PulG
VTGPPISTAGSDAHRQRAAAAPDRPGSATDAGPDAGITLLELVVSMTIMSIVMAVFITGIVQVFRMTTTTESRSNAQSQLATAFLRLEREVRYAVEIEDPYLASGAQHIAFLVARTGGRSCVQLRVYSKRLELRRWTPPTPPSTVRTNLTAWGTLASGVTSSQPFTRKPADDDVSYQRLEVKLVTMSGPVNRNIASVFTAVNSGRGTGSGACADKTP